MYRKHTAKSRRKRGVGEDLSPIFEAEVKVEHDCAGARATSSGKLADSENSEKIATF